MQIFPARLFSLALILLASAPGLAQDNAQALLGKMIETIRKHQSISYTADFRIKYWQGDVGTATSVVHMLRDERDTIWGGMVWQSEGLKPETYSFYDLDKRYIVMSQIRKVWRERPQKNMGLSNVYQYLVSFPFLKPKQLEDYLSEESGKLADTTISGRQCYVVETKKYHTNKTDFTRHVFYLNKEDYFPVMIRRQGAPTDQSEYSILIFTRYEFDKVSKDQFSPKQIPADYTIGTRDRELPKAAQPQVRPRNEWPLPGR